MKGNLCAGFNEKSYNQSNKYVVNLMDPEHRFVGVYTSVHNNCQMSLVFCANSVKLYPDVDRRATDSLTPSLNISIRKNGIF